MTDRELLELAAKAAGIDGQFLDDAKGGAIVYWVQPQYTDQQPVCAFWRPLADDGDALRLAVKLGIEITIGHWETKFVYAEQRTFRTEFGLEWQDLIQSGERLVDDPYAATRRAIVLTAAKIGEAMQAAT